MIVIMDQNDEESEMIGILRRKPLHRDLLLRRKQNSD